MDRLCRRDHVLLFHNRRQQNRALGVSKIELWSVRGLAHLAWLMSCLSCYPGGLLYMTKLKDIDVRSRVPYLGERISSWRRVNLHLGICDDDRFAFKIGLTILYGVAKSSNVCNHSQTKESLCAGTNRLRLPVPASAGFSRGRDVYRASSPHLQPNTTSCEFWSLLYHNYECMPTILRMDRG